jgi:hypothetical protein
MLALRQAGWTYKQIADRYGLCSGSKIENRLGLKPTRRARNIYPRPGEPGYRNFP